WPGNPGTCGEPTNSGGLAVPGYLKWGLYRDQNTNALETVFQHGLRSGTSYDSVEPLLRNLNAELVGAQSGRCIDVTNFGTTVGSPLQLYDCAGTTNQEWSWTGSSGIYDPTPCPENGMVGTGSHLCLQTSGTGATLQTCDVTVANQTWSFGGQVISIGSKCLDDPSGNTANGTRAQIWDCQTSNANQLWTFVPGLGSGRGG